MNLKKFSGLTFLFSLMVLAGIAQAFEVPDRAGVGQKAFRAAELEIDNQFLLTSELPAQEASQATADLVVLGANNGARLDARSGRWATLMMAEPLLPGRGVGNDLNWGNLGIAAPRSDAELAEAASNAFHEFLQAASQEFRIDMAELAEDKVTVLRDGAVIQIYVPRVFEGVRVHGSSLTGTINHGNLVLFGTNHWAEINVSTAPLLSGLEARNAVQSHVNPHQISGSWGKTSLVLVPVAKGQDADQVPFGEGYEHRLAWVVRPEFGRDLRRFEALVDAHTGQILSFEDTNHYIDVAGGVLPVSNDGVFPDGVEQPGWPMPFQDTSLGTTDTGGNVAGADSITASFTGPFVYINDNCGAASLTQSDGIDWGASGGTDCTTPGFGGPGNTHASRTGFFELNKIIEMAQGQLPSNGWLQNTLTSNMNINQTCNAFWNGSVNFYRSGGGCANTGELAGVFDHEWGHGLDDNDAFPTIASPSGEGIADIYTALRLNSSCIGRNFRATPCSGNGDPCLTCTGVRDIDYLQRQSGQPHDYTWSNANCGGSVHCVGAVYSEAVWSLWKRKLQSAPYGYDNNTAWEIVNRLTFIGAGNTGTWFSGGPPNGGCAAGSGYMNYLAADDDNGNLNDGTPHMTAIFNAFNDQEIACGTPTVQDSGCSGGPAAQPVVTTGNGNTLVTLNWGAVPNTTEYEVFRTEGVFACDFGKVRLGSTTGTSWNDTGLQNGRDYSYVVIPKGASDSCFGPASACATEAPVGAPDFAVSCSPSALSIAQGDSDSVTCTAGSSFGYSGTVALSCSGNPAGVSCLFSPDSVEVPADGTAASTLTLEADLGQATGTFNFDVVGDDGGAQRTATVSVQVIPEGSAGPQEAAYDAGLGAPRCSVAGSSCDSVDLLDGRASLGPEPNQPNTLDVCADGTSGTYHNDESNDRIVVSTLDGGNFTEGDTVEIAATVWAWSTGSSDTLDLYYTADAMSPSWQYIGSIVPPGGGAHTLTAQYTLPAGSMQAVRANFRYQGTVSPCSTGNWDDTDDLVFAVEAPAPGCVVDADCDNGLFCDGVEFCNAGVCQAGTPPVCDDGLFCNGAETCNEAADTCDPGTPPVIDDGVGCTVDSCDEDDDVVVHAPDNSVCDNGQFCDGAEVCDPVADCRAGTAPTCDDGAFCNGVETCNEGTDSCDPGTPPSADDGVGCTDDSCDEATDSIVNTPNDANCDNGLFCDGAETCNPTLDCQAGTDPCPDGTCDEVADVCNVPEPVDVHVEFIETGTQAADKGQKNGTALVTVHDSNGIPVGAGYTVTGNFSGSFNENGVTGVTDAAGVALLVSDGKAKKNIVVNFCVSSVSGALPYDEADNADPGYACGGDTTDPVSVHVESVSTGSQGAGGGGFKAGTATITILDDIGGPAAGYTVTGDFGGTFTEPDVSGVTGADGTVKLVTAGSEKGNINVTFCVSNLVKEAGLPWDQNADTEGTTCP